MITVDHVLLDGTKLQSVSGHVVRISDAETVYRIADKMSNERILKNDNV